MPSLVAAGSSSSKAGERRMDVDAATGKGEEDSAEAEKSALAGKHL